MVFYKNATKAVQTIKEFENGLYLSNNTTFYISFVLMNTSFLNSVKRVIFHFLFWFLVWFFFYNFFSVGSTSQQFLFWFSTLLSVVAITASYVFMYDLIPKYLITKQYRKFILYTVYSFVFVTCGVLMTITFGFVFFFNLEFQQMPMLTKSSAVILVCVLLIVVLASGLKILKHNYKSLEENKTLENKFLQTQLQLKEQELMFLKMQIHPHFLFNSLNTIYGFALTKKNEAPEMILKLSNLLDYILYQVNKPLVFLKDEIHHIEDYLSLEKMRFNDTLEVNLDVHNISDTIQVTPMLLIPFVENSFKHGEIINGKLKISISIEIKGKSLFFTIKNSTKNKDESVNGIGLMNLRKRLEMFYNDNFNLEIHHSNNEFIANLCIIINQF